MIAELRRQLLALTKNDGGIFALKTGTEAEDMDHPEIAMMRELSNSIVPLIVKLSGPEARVDMRKLLALPCDGIVAPLIESPYALQKFIQTRKQIESEQPQTDYTRIFSAINIESETGIQQLSKIIKVAEFSAIHQVTAARTDLSQSLGLVADHPTVMQICKKLLQTCRQHGKRTVVGGSITPHIVTKIIQEIQPDYISTRNVLLDTSVLKKSADGGVKQTLKILQFEIEICSAFARLFPKKSQIYTHRCQVLEHRKDISTPLL